MQRNRRLRGRILVMAREDISRRELLTLKQIQLTGRATDHDTTLQLLKQSMISDVEDGQLKLTKRGRHALVRGSPSLWDISA